MANKLKKGYIKIDTELCKGCYICKTACPENLIFVSEKLNSKGYYPVNYCEEETEIDKHLCKGCALCGIVCPDVAIEVYRE